MLIKKEKKVLKLISKKLYIYNKYELNFYYIIRKAKIQWTRDNLLKFFKLYYFNLYLQSLQVDFIWNNFNQKYSYYLINNNLFHSFNYFQFITRFFSRN